MCNQRVNEKETSFETMPLIIYSSIAQLVERRTVNPQVAGSSPAGGAASMQEPFRGDAINHANEN